MIAIIMCTWQRLNNLESTISTLEIQTNKKFDFYIWNNNVSLQDTINKLISNRTINIGVKHSPANEGGYGRFLYARELCNKYDKIVFIDDDQFFTNTLVETFINAYEEKTIKSWWAWKCINSYGNRRRVSLKEKANYCGTGGMILDSSIFKCPKLYQLPQKYKFVEDLWLCYIAEQILKWNLYHIKIDINIKTDGKDQYKKLWNLKNEFWKYLYIKHEKV